MYVLEADTKVAKLIDNERKEWKVELIARIFSKVEKSERKWSTSIERKDADQWKNVWALEVPGGYKHFVWNVLNNAFHTRSNLFKRKVSEDSWCPICRREEEDVQYALWCCPGVANVWSDDGGPVKKWLNQIIDFSNLWMELSNRLSPRCLARIVAIMRGIWRRRNAFVFEDKFTSPNDLINMRIGIGILVRDCHGNVLVVVCLRKDDVVSPFIAECLALKISIEFCLEMGFWSIMMEGDAKGMIEAVLSEELDESVHGQLIDDTNRLLDKDYIGLWVLYIGKEI
ncbi:uncharacterized protein LOC121235603 [Juglans microcarpa x Juglans regia]|uniref:uncharacterized protein LOC121235603 n=1 Tax=Juglans microcarpa x Juglans regia TaxID=2249226 RepID=UPI001B7EC104|nr:uncharacterized protein LOC121235603 [Juglans microcarpa x Juglans regia]